MKMMINLRLVNRGTLERKAERDKELLSLITV